MPPRLCVYCDRTFEPSRFRPDQRVCSDAACQKRRRAEYHKNKIATDPDYAQVVRDSRRKWREAHPSYQAEYWRTHGDAADRNREQQRHRDRKRHVRNLLRNTAASSVSARRLDVYAVAATTEYPSAWA